MGGFVGYAVVNEISNVMVENVILRLDKTQLVNPLHKDGEKAINRWIGAIVGRADSAVPTLTDMW